MSAPKKMHAGLALLLAPKKGEGEDPSDEYDKGDDEDTEDDYMKLAEEAFPDEDWTPQRVAALKEFVMKCMG